MRISDCSSDVCSSDLTQDANLAFLGTSLNEIGVRLVEARVVPDIEAEIVAALNALRARWDYVFTTGGIGPTHDDITDESIAKARSEERRVGKEGGSTCKSRGSPEH